MQKDRMRYRASVALALGSLCFFPWCAGLMLHGGLKAKDKVTRNINRLAVFLMCCAIIVVVSLVVIRYSIKENFWCPISLPCDRTCATACTPCSSCIDKGHWWCFQPRVKSKGFCSHEDRSKDDFYTQPGKKPIWTPGIACSQSCGCNGCLNGGYNWCRYPIESLNALGSSAAAANRSAYATITRNTSHSRALLRGSISSLSFDGNGNEEIEARSLDLLSSRQANNSLFRSKAQSHSKPSASHASMFRQAQWSVDGDDGYCDMSKTTQGQDRTPSENPARCSASSCCCDSQGCHPRKCST